MARPSDQADPAQPAERQPTPGGPFSPSVGQVAQQLPRYAELGGSPEYPAWQPGGARIPEFTTYDVPWRVTDTTNAPWAPTPQEQQWQRNVERRRPGEQANVGQDALTILDAIMARQGYQVVGRPSFVVGAPQGLVQMGNLDLNARPVVRNRDGSISTVRTITIMTDQGAVLLPTVIGGRVVSEQQAVAHWRKTGEHLGVFDTEENANAYAQSLHQSQAKQYR